MLVLKKWWPKPQEKLLTFLCSVRWTWGLQPTSAELPKSTNFTPSQAFRAANDSHIFQGIRILINERNGCTYESLSDAALLFGCGLFSFNAGWFACWWSLCERGCQLEWIAVCSRGGWARSTFCSICWDGFWEGKFCWGFLLSSCAYVVLRALSIFKCRFFRFRRAIPRIGSHLLVQISSRFCICCSGGSFRRWWYKWTWKYRLRCIHSFLLKWW